MLSTSNERTLQGELWRSVMETVGPQEIQPDCANCLRAWIAIGVERMEMEGRLTSEDLAIAHANLRNFIRLAKIETVFLTQFGQLDRYALHAAQQRIQRQARLTTFFLWPFWPNEFAPNQGEQS
jgi:hypothetical protein